MVGISIVFVPNLFLLSAPAAVPLKRLSAVPPGNGRQLVSVRPLRRGGVGPVAPGRHLEAQVNMKGGKEDMNEMQKDEVNATDTVALTHVVKATDTINPD